VVVVDRLYRSEERHARGRGASVKTRRDNNYQHEGTNTYRAFARSSRNSVTGRPDSKRTGGPEGLGSVSRGSNHARRRVGDGREGVRGTWGTG
jgi:hypothetical protein